MTTPASLVEALEDEFEGDVAFAAAMPNTFLPSSVVVLPNPEGWVAPKHAGSDAERVLIRESWDVLAIASMENQAKGVEVMRGLSLRVMRALSKVGAVWGGATLRAVAGADNKPLVAAVNSITFSYPANTHLPEEEG